MNYREIAGQILQHMGGKDNISAVTYCMTRLRMTQKDKGLVNEEDVYKRQVLYSLGDCVNRIRASSFVCGADSHTTASSLHTGVSVCVINLLSFIFLTKGKCPAKSR